MPMTSSITTGPGSVTPSARSVSVAAHAPIAHEQRDQRDFDEHAGAGRSRRRPDDDADGRADGAGGDGEPAAVPGGGDGERERSH